MKYILVKTYVKSFLCFLFLFLLQNCSNQRISYSNEYSYIDTTEFVNSARQWHDIKNKDNIIEPSKDQKRYPAADYKKIADNILLFQKSNGGWTKNYDMHAILTDEQKIAVIKSKNILNTCFDNGATYSQLNYLARVFTSTKSDKYKIAFIDGINFILSAQYDNGGWSQFYPDVSGYRKYITDNDGAMIGVMKLLQRIVNKESDYNFIDSMMYNKVTHHTKKTIKHKINCTNPIDLLFLSRYL